MRRDDLREAWLGHRPLWAYELPAAILLSSVGVWQATTQLTSWTAWAVALGGLIWAERLLALRRRLAESWRETEAALSSVHLLVSEWGLVATTPRGETRAEWRAYTDAHEIEAGFLLYRSPEDYAFIPMRAFGSREAVAAFQNVLGRHIEGPRWRRSRRGRMTPR